MFRGMDWRVVTLKYGRQLEPAFARRGGDALRDWIDACPNVQYSALAHAGGAPLAGRLRAISATPRASASSSTSTTIERLQALMTNLGGHDLETVLNAFHGAHG